MFGQFGRPFRNRVSLFLQPQGPVLRGHKQQFRSQEFLCCWSPCVERLAVTSTTRYNYKHFKTFRL